MLRPIGGRNFQGGFTALITWVALFILISLIHGSSEQQLSSWDKKEDNIYNIMRLAGEEIAKKESLEPNKYFLKRAKCYHYGHSCLGAQSKRTGSQPLAYEDVNRNEFEDYIRRVLLKFHQRNEIPDRDQMDYGDFRYKLKSNNKRNKEYPVYAIKAHHEFASNGIDEE